MVTVPLLLMLLLSEPQETLSDPVSHYCGMVSPDASMCECLSCHDGSQAVKIASCSDASRHYNRHLVGVTYPPKWGGTAYASLQAVEANGLRFEGGQITCYTCHDLRSANPFQLALPTPELCRTCHHRH